MTIKELAIHAKALVTTIGGTGERRRHLLDMGLVPGTLVEVMNFAPMGDPMEIRLHGYQLSLRLADAELIAVEPVAKDYKEAALSFASFNINTHPHDADHPGLGEGGRYHDKSHEHPLPKDTPLLFAIVGQQNCGATTLFNQLTGENQHVGNFPGVTVDCMEGTVKGYANATVVDLPGINSLSAYTTEEELTRDFILDRHPHCIINIVDANNIERNLYLTMQLMELGIPMVLALNMTDELRANGGALRLNEMEQYMGLPVVPIAALRGEGVSELMEHAMHVATFQEPPARQDFCCSEDYGGAVHRAIHGVMHLIEDHATDAGIAVRFAATKLLEGDTHLAERIRLSKNELETIEHVAGQLEQERGLDRSAALADMRYGFIKRLCAATVVKPRESKAFRRSRKIDKVLTGQWTALPIFLVVMVLTIWLSIDVIGAPLQALLESGITSLGESVDAWMESINVATPVRSLVTDGIFGGVGNVLSFVPIIIVLFFFLSILEDSGYMARAAFVTDGLMRRLGLSGRSVVPMLMGFGCSVPAFMSCRTIPSARNRRLTILLIPFMSCSAKIPIYTFLCGAFFPQHAGLAMVCVYLLGIVMGVVVAAGYRLIYRSEAPAPFIMELPNYRAPSMRNMMHILWDQTREFISRAFSVILVATIIIWFLQTFSFRGHIVSDPSESILAVLAGFPTALFAPIGLDSWQMLSSLVTGFIAKESVVSTLEVLGGVSLLTPASAVSLLIFSLLYTPCVAAIAAVRRELGMKGALFTVAFQCVVAYLVAFVGYQIAVAIM